ncbi:unnamed protein product [Calypogeia fissa]
MERVNDSVGPSLSDEEYESLWRDLWELEDNVTFSIVLLRIRKFLSPTLRKSMVTPFAMMEFHGRPWIDSFSGYFLFCSFFGLASQGYFDGGFSISLQPYPVGLCGLPSPLFWLPTDMV